jgi:hypothetical protein
MNAANLHSVVSSDSSPSTALRDAFAAYDDASERLAALEAEIAAAKVEKEGTVEAIATLKGYEPGSKAPKIKLIHPTSKARLVLVVKPSRTPGKMSFFFRGENQSNDFEEV